MAQYVLLGGFASTAAGISAQGLVGFARSNMALRGPWPYLLFFALDGAAGVCAVLRVTNCITAKIATAICVAVRMAFTTCEKSRTLQQRSWQSPLHSSSETVL